MPLQFYVDSSGPDWAIHCCLVDFLKPVATISLAENSNVVGQLLKRGYLSGENCPVNFWATFLSTLGDFFFIAVICVQSLGDFLLKSTFPMVDSQFLPRVSEGCVTKVMKMFRETERTKSHI